MASNLTLESPDSGDILGLFDVEQRRDVEYFETIREATPTIVRHTSRFGGDGLVTYWDLAGTDVMSVVQEQIAYFNSIGQDFEWKVYAHDSPAELGQQLARLGFTVDHKATVVYLDLSALPERLAALTNPNVKQVIEPEGIDEYVAMMQSIWDGDFCDVASSLKAQLQEDASHIGVYLARADGMVASAGWIRFHQASSFASLRGGLTLPAWRNRGLYSALVAVRVLEAQRRGYRYVIVDARPTSRPILERLGFKVLAHICVYVWSTRRHPGNKSE